MEPKQSFSSVPNNKYNPISNAPLCIKADSHRHRVHIRRLPPLPSTEEKMNGQPSPSGARGPQLQQMASTSTEFVILAGHCLTFVQQRLEAFECRVCREYWTRAANAKPSKCRCDASQHSAVTDYRSYLAFRNKISNEIAHHQLVMACTVQEHECKVAWHPLQPRPQPAPGPSPSPSHMFGFHGDRASAQPNADSVGHALGAGPGMRPQNPPTKNGGTPIAGGPAPEVQPAATAEMLSPSLARNNFRKILKGKMNPFPQGSHTTMPSFGRDNSLDQRLCLPLYQHPQGPRNMALAPSPLPPSSSTPRSPGWGVNQYTSVLSAYISNWGHQRKQPVWQ